LRLGAHRGLAGGRLEARAQIERRLHEVFVAVESKDFERLESYHLYGPKFTRFSGTSAARQDAATTRKIEHDGLASLQALNYEPVTLPATSSSRRPTTSRPSRTSRALWKDILANAAQLEAWKDLFAVEPRKVNEKFLAEHPTLVVNTAHFDAAFKERLLAAFDDIDEATDGLLIHSENYQALRFLERRYAEQVECIYIDPPYNTGSDDFLYKDRYQHSTWAAMMQERLCVAREFLAREGVIFSSIDDNEQPRLRMLMDSVFGEESIDSNIIW
jgi:hypothetical protein